MLELFNLVEYANITDANYADYMDRIVLENVIDKNTGDDLGIPANTKLNEDHLNLIVHSKLKKIFLS